MKKGLLVFAIVILCMSCGGRKSPATDFSRDDISFTVPQGWTITEEEDYGEGYYLSIEKQGGNESGIITVSWLLDQEDITPAEYMQMIVTNMTSTGVYEGFSVEDISCAEFNGIPATGKSYSGIIMGLAHEGSMHTIGKNGKVIQVTMQQANEDDSSNREGFEVFEHSFMVE